MKLKFFCISAGTHPKLGPVFYRLAQATDNLNGNRYNQYVCEVLGAVAQRVEDCDRILNYINEVESGRQKEVETGGNDVILTLKPDGIQVDILANEDWIGQPEGKFQLKEWGNALMGWREFLQMPLSLSSFLEVEL